MFGTSTIAAAGCSLAKYSLYGVKAVVTIGAGYILANECEKRAHGSGHIKQLIADASDTFSALLQDGLTWDSIQEEQTWKRLQVIAQGVLVGSACSIGLSLALNFVARPISFLSFLKTGPAGMAAQVVAITAIIALPKD